MHSYHVSGSVAHLFVPFRYFVFVFGELDRTHDLLSLFIFDAYALILCACVCAARSLSHFDPIVVCLFNYYYLVCSALVFSKNKSNFSLPNMLKFSDIVTQFIQRTYCLS